MKITYHYQASQKLCAIQVNCFVNMTPKLYMAEISSPCRAVLLTAKALDVALDTVILDLFNKKDQLSPEFLKLNPQHTVPTLVDGDFIIWDSHAIAGYLVGQYGKGDGLYPTDPKKKALVDQRLFFETDVLTRTLRALTRPILYHGATTIEKQKLADVLDCYKFLEAFLEGHDWIAGNNVTIADFSCIARVSSMDGLVPISYDRFPRLSSWYSRCKSWPYYEEANGYGRDRFVNILKTKIQGYV